MEKSIKHHTSNTNSIETEKDENHKREREELLNSFVAKNVGRGIWTMFMTIVFMLKNNIPQGYSALQCISIIHYVFMHYCKDIYCLICRAHAARYISNHKIIDKLYEINNSMEDEQDRDHLVLYTYFVWLYDFRNSANSFANKANPELDDVIRFFNGEESTIKSEDFSYEKLKDGIWHCIFVLVAKCSTIQQVRAVYFVICNYFKFLPLRQKQYYIEFKEKYDFSIVLEDYEATAENVCVAFFEWTYMLYEHVNVGYKIYSEDIIKDVNYNSTFCTKKCGE